LRLDVVFLLSLGLANLPLWQMVVVTRLGMGLVTRFCMGACLGGMDVL
jgi:hypothetical protein